MPVTGQGPASSTVTRSTRPSSVKTWVIPSFLARIAATSPRQTDLDVDARRQVVEPLERVDRLRRGLMDVDEPLVRADLEVLLRVLVLERRPDDGVHVLLGRQRDGAGHGRAGAGRRLDDLLRRRLDGRVVVGLQADADLALGGGRHAGVLCLASVSSAVGSLLGACAPGGGSRRKTGPAPWVRLRRSGALGMSWRAKGPPAPGAGGPLGVLLEDLGH